VRLASNWQRHLAPVLLAALVGVGSAARAYADDSRRYAGRPLAEALEDLRSQGLRLIYSSDLVRPDLIVADEPDADSPRLVLDRLLAPFGLRSQDGPGDTVLVVRGQDSGAAGLPAFREEVEVSTSAPRATSDQPGAITTLGPGALSATTQFGDDPSRAVALLPGVAAADKSAAFGVRGGEADETLFVLDGLVLRDPFHLKDFLNFSSVVDAEALGGVEFLSGAFPAEYGGRMSAIVDQSSRHPAGTPRVSITTSSVDSGVLSEGGFRERSGGWLLSTRAWRPDAMVDTVDPGGEGLNPLYYDLLAKVETTLAGGTILSGHVLAAQDAVHADAAPDQGRVTAEDGSQYAWLNLETPWSDRLFSRTVLSTGRSERIRHGGFADPDTGNGLVSDERSSASEGFRQDWLYRPSGTTLLGWGFEARRVEAGYDYASHVVAVDPLFTGGLPVSTDRSASLAPLGTELGAFVSDRFRLSPSLTLELGARWDRQTFTAEDEVSPRINTVWALGPRSALRLGWGLFYQPQGPEEIQVEDGVREPYAAERAEHRTLNFDHLFASGLSLGVGVYDKEMTRLHPRYVNLFNPMLIFAEVEPDRTRVDPERASAKGIELTLARDGGRALTWWAAYALARADDQIGGRMVPRDHDQRHTLNFIVHYRRGGAWDLTLAGQYHSGWPTTGIETETVQNADGSLNTIPILGPRNGLRFPPYHRLDLKLSRRFEFNRGTLRAFLGVTNLYGRDNVCCAREIRYLPLPDGTLRVERQDGFWMRRLPVFGLTWEFRP